MGASTPLRVLYYGLLASVTGGFVFPFNDTKKNRVYIFVFHLYTFLMFFIPPLGLLYGIQDDLMHWKIGWGVFGAAILVYFTAVKIVNFRLHRALGRDPVEEDQKEEPGGMSPAAESPEGVSAEGMSPSKDVKSVKMNELSDVALEGEMAVLGGEDGVKEESFTQIKGVTVEVTSPKPEQTTLPEPPAFMKETSEDIARQGGASLSQSSSPSTEGVAQIEMTSVESKPDQHAGVSVESKPDQHAGVSVESKPDQHAGVSVESKPDQHAGVSVESKPDQQDPLEKSASTEENLEGQFKSTPQLISALDDLEELKARLQSQPSLMNSGEVDDTGAIRQRSNSLPWRSEVMALDRRRAFNRSFRQPVRQRRGRPEERTTDLPQSNNSPLPLLPPLPSLFMSSEDREDPVTPLPPPPPPVPASSRLQPTSPQLLRSEIRSVVTAFRVRGYSLPPSVVSKLSTDVIQAINCGSLSDTTYSYISAKISELRRGRLAKTHDEIGNNLIHWFQVDDGEWEFYVIEGDDGAPFDQEDSFEDTDSDNDLTQTHSISRDAYHGDLTYRDLEFRDSINSPSSVPPPRIEPVPQSSSAREEPPPKYCIIPRVQATGVTIKLNRNQLEEFMDRNHTVWEVIVTTLLATAIVPVTAALLLMDFFQGNLAAGFFLCYMATTAMFSLIKSVHPDPASSTPDANRYSASSRAFYYILLGCIALILNAFLPPQGSPGDALCVYGTNLSMTLTIMKARDAMLYIILFFPVLYIVGVLPQVNTFIIWILEQIEMFIFGGTASTSVFSSIFALGRSLLFTALLWPLGYAGYAVYTCGESSPCLENMSCVRKACPAPASPCVFNVAFSIYLGILFAAAYHLSRATSNYRLYLDLVLNALGKMFLKCCPSSYCGKKQYLKETKKDDLSDPLEGTYRNALKLRLLQELAYCIVIFVIVTALSLSTVFCVAFEFDYKGRPIPYLHLTLCTLTALLGMVNHYLVPHTRKETPWICIAQPLLKAKEYGQFEATDDPAVTYFEHAYAVSLFCEKNILYPLIFLSGLHIAAPNTLCVFGPFGAALVTTVVGLRVLRYAYGELSRQHMILTLTVLFFNFDYAHLSEGFPLDYFIMSFIFYKVYDLLLKMRFIFAYIAPWNVNWSSIKHVFIQPLLIPHTPFIFFMALAGAVLNAAINPISASTLFLLSYMRPLKFWEKDYNTKRSDNKNTRLDSQLEKMQRSQDQDHYDSLYYEHLTWVLQKELCGDLHLGRWGRVTAGDFFILTSDKLNALVHIIEYGNGFVTFQLRGLEFGGTYCHQREVEAITEPISEEEGCLCCSCCKIPGILSFNSAVAQRWFTWEVVSSCYVLKGYSIAENQLYLMFNTHEYRKSYLTFLVQSVIYKLSTSPSLTPWLENDVLRESLRHMAEPDYMDSWAVFSDSRIYLVDYDISKDGITREAFLFEFFPLIQNCTREAMGRDVDRNDFFVTLAFALSLAARRSFLSLMQQGGGSRSSSDFMHSVYQMFVGDARPHDNDTWLLSIIESIDMIIIPAVRMAVKLHEDSFTGYSGVNEAFNTMKDIEEHHLITYEADRRWRNAVVTNHPSLLAIRYQNQPHDYFNYGSSSNPYKMIRLTTKNVLFRVVKINRECVRALWTSQQHELLFIRSDDSERGSIQNAKSVLRNMVNSSMDLPLGYPIYVSPLTTSYIENHSKLKDTIQEKATSPKWLATSTYHALLKCKACSQKLSTSQAQAKPPATQPATPSQPRDPANQDSVEPLTGLPREPGIGSDIPYIDYISGESSDEEDVFELKWIGKDVVICDLTHVHESFNQGWLKWPDPSWKSKVGKNNWKDWRPEEGMAARVIHEWRPFHIKYENRSPLDKVMLLVEVDENHLVLINEQGVGDTTKL